MQMAQQRAERWTAVWRTMGRHAHLRMCLRLGAAVVIALSGVSEIAIAQDKAEPAVKSDAAKPAGSDAPQGDAVKTGTKPEDETAAKDEAPKPDWDQVANIKEAATRLAQIQRTQGANGAFTFIDACYRTHRLSSAYTRAFEACIAQDYLETQILSLVYSRMPPEVLKRMKAPSPEMLAGTMLRRVSAAFGQYKLSKAQVAEFKRNVDAHGFPIMFTALFPNTPLPVVPQAIPGDKPDDGQTTPDTSPKPDTTKPEKQ